MFARRPFGTKVSIFSRFLSSLECCLENGLRWFSPLYVLAAVSLILTVAYVFYFILLVEIAPIERSYVLVLHKVLALCLLFNVLFNYYMCVTSSAGSTFDVDQSVLYNGYAEYKWRFCKVCDLPKPDLAHHCSICKRCILRMDHHCPWVGNCVGHRNYRYFYLFLFYITLGCIYAFAMMYHHRRLFLLKHDPIILPIFCTVLCAALGLAVGNLLLWHTFLIATGQGTIDFIDNFRKWKEAFKEGRLWKNPYSQGCINNFKAVFDVDGRYWWLLWMLPNWKPKSGSGLYNTNHHLTNYA